MLGEFRTKQQVAEEWADLAPEIDLVGHIEYKYNLYFLPLKGVESKIAQMATRLHQGAGQCCYVLGVHDCGKVLGCSEALIEETLLALFFMARS